MEDSCQILKVLKKTNLAVKKRNFIEIKNLSNQLVHCSSINQDPDVISVAIIVYALSKLIEREKYKEYRTWPKFYNNYVKCLNNSIRYLESNNIDAMRKEIENIRQSIQSLSGHLKDYIEEVFRKAQINKASRIYEHGISMEKTAKILGISVWELAEYAGQTKIADVNLAVTMLIKQRIKLAQDFFK